MVYCIFIPPLSLSLSDSATFLLYYFILLFYSETALDSRKVTIDKLTECLCLPHPAAPDDSILGYHSTTAKIQRLNSSRWVQYYKETTDPYFDITGLFYV